MAAEPLIVDWALNITCRETLEANVPAATRPTITHAAWNDSGTLKSSSTPPATKCAVFEKTLVYGAATIDLTALSGTNDIDVDGTGLKVQAIKILNPGSNSNPLVIAPGSSNGYDLLGAAAKITLNPGEQFQWIGADADAAVVISASARTIDLSDDGANGTDTHQFVVVLG